MPQQWRAAREREKQEESVSTASRRIARQAARKRHRAELMIPHLTDLNFVLYWPHCLHAHPELYERWDFNSLFYFCILFIWLRIKVRGYRPSCLSPGCQQYRK